MGRQAVAVAPLVALAFLMGGCGTLVNHSEPGCYFNWDGRTPFRPYGGVLNAADMAATNAGRVVGDDPSYDPYSAAAASAANLFIDLPLSAAADTILLPLDVTNTLLGRGKPPEGGWPLLHGRPVPDEGWAPRRESARTSEANKGNALAELADGKFSNWSGSMWPFGLAKPAAAKSDDTSVWKRSYEPFEAYSYPSPPKSQRGPAD